jgi:hypothetical protein
VPDPSPCEPGTSSRGAMPEAQKRDQGRKRKAVAQVLGPRPNLRNTLARQARANLKVIQ